MHLLFSSLISVGRFLVAKLLYSSKCPSDRLEETYISQLLFKHPVFNFLGPSV